MIETKVIAATAGSGFGAACSSFLLWDLGVNFWGVSNTAGAAGAAIAAVPAPVSVVVALLVSAGCTALAGYATPHTHRPDLTVTPETEISPEAKQVLIPEALIPEAPPAAPAPLPTPVVDITSPVPPV